MAWQLVIFENISYNEIEFDERKPITLWLVAGGLVEAPVIIKLTGYFAWMGIAFTGFLMEIQFSKGAASANISIYSGVMSISKPRWDYDFSRPACRSTLS